MTRLTSYRVSRIDASMSHRTWTAHHAARYNRTSPTLLETKELCPFTSGLSAVRSMIGALNVFPFASMMATCQILDDGQIPIQGFCPFCYMWLGDSLVLLVFLHVFLKNPHSGVTIRVKNKFCIPLLCNSLTL